MGFRALEDDFVWVESGDASTRAPPDIYARSDHCTSVASYDGQLGMRTRRAVQRQLCADLPRSHVTIDGRRVVEAQDALARVRRPRLLTQAVLAPPVEWLLRAGFVAHELPASAPLGSRRMRVDVRDGGRWVHVRKLFRVRRETGAACPHLLVLITADERRDTLVVSMMAVGGT